MAKSVFSLQRLAESKKTIRAVTAVALWSLTAPVYSGGLTNFVKNVTDRTILYVYSEQSDAQISPTLETKRGVAAIVYSASENKHGLTSSSAYRVSQVSSALGEHYTVTDLTPVRDYTLNAAKKEEDRKYWGMTSGAWIGTTIVVLGVGFAASSTNDDGNRDNNPD